MSIMDIMADGTNACCPCPGFWTVITGVAAGLTAFGMIGNLCISLVQRLINERRHSHKRRTDNTLPAAMESPPMVDTVLPPFMAIPSMATSPDIGTPMSRAPTTPVPRTHIVIEKSDHEAFVRDLIKAMHNDHLERLEREVQGSKAWRDTYGHKVDELVGWRNAHREDAKSVEHARTTGFELRRRDVRSD